MQKYFVYVGERMIAVVHARSEQNAIIIAREKTIGAFAANGDFATAVRYRYRRSGDHPARFVLPFKTSFGP
jgi:hypothetical protein